MNDYDDDDDKNKIEEYNVKGKHVAKDAQQTWETFWTNPLKCRRLGGLHFSCNASLKET